jgi:glycosyltransferase involved in cell wall biosynthesis
VTPAPARPRLLVVGPVPPPIGGVETCTQAVLEARALGVFEVAHCDISKGRPKSTQGAFDAGNFAWALRHFSRLVRALRESRPDVVYVQVSGSLSGVLRDLVLGAIARRSGARVIGHQHAGEVEKQLARGGPLGAAIHSGFARFHRLLVLGPSWQRLFEAQRLSLPISVCPSTFRREVFETARAFVRPRRATGPLRLLFVGQVGRNKGVPDLLHALRRLAERDLDVSLTLVGPEELPGQADACRALAAELKLGDRVRFAGTLMGEVLYAQFREHDAFVLPSFREGLPVVLFEAGAFELPVVTTRVGSIPDLVRHDANGLFVEPGHPEQLAGVLELLARDPARRERLGARLRTDILAYHPERIGALVADAVWAELAIAGRVSGERPRLEDESAWTPAAHGGGA